MDINEPVIKDLTKQSFGIKDLVSPITIKERKYKY